MSCSFQHCPRLSSSHPLLLLLSKNSKVQHSTGLAEQTRNWQQPPPARPPVILVQWRVHSQAPHQVGVADEVAAKHDSISLARCHSRNGSVALEATWQRAGRQDQAPTQCGRPHKSVLAGLFVGCTPKPVTHRHERFTRVWRHSKVHSIQLSTPLASSAAKKTTPHSGLLLVQGSLHASAAGPAAPPAARKGLLVSTI